MRCFAHSLYLKKGWLKSGIIFSLFSIFFLFCWAWLCQKMNLLLRTRGHEQIIINYTYSSRTWIFSMCNLLGLFFSSFSWSLLRFYSQDFFSKRRRWRCLFLICWFLVVVVCCCIVVLVVVRGLNNAMFDEDVAVEAMTYLFQKFNYKHTKITSRTN